MVMPGRTPAKARVSAGLRSASAALSASGRLASATAAVIAADGACARAGPASSSRPASADPIRWFFMCFSLECWFYMAAILFVLWGFFMTPLDSGRYFDRHPRLALGGMDHQRGFDAGDV